MVEIEDRWLSMTEICQHLGVSNDTVYKWIDKHDKALQRVVIDLLADHTELFKQFSDNPSFKKWLGDTIFGVTYQTPSSVNAGAVIDR